MQAVFAFRQKEESNFNLALNDIDETFAPDLDSMTPPDHQALNFNKKESKKLFEKHYLAKKLPSLPEVDEEITDAVQQALNFFWDAMKKDIRKHKQQLVADTDNVKDHYYNLLLFLTELYDLEVLQQKTAFNNFDTLKLLVEDDQFQAEIAKRNLSWNGEEDILLVRKIYKEEICSNEMFISFLKDEDKTVQKEQDLLRHLLKSIIMKNGVVETRFDESDVQWEENQEVVKSLVQKTIKKLADGNVVHFSLSENWDEDKEFLVKLFTAGIEQNTDLKERIAKSLKNWKLDRVALTDQIAIEMAILEMINFPSIPTKVTINEYIELSKRYSTPKSKQFVNGVLDVLSVQLQKEGVIKKSGRGLIDNK